MNTLDSQDFERDVDYTIINPITAPDFNTGLDTLSPKVISDRVGKGIVLVTVDTATVADVPNPDESAEFNKWKTYLWARMPDSATGNTRVIIYAWSDDYANPDPLLLSWFDTREDISALVASVTANTAAIVTATNTANSAATNANNAVTTATTANTNATSALNSVAAATAAAVAATTAATTALNTANAAAVVAATANAAAANAVTIAAGNKTVTQITPGTAGQMIRTSDAGVNEYFDIQKTIVILAESIVNTGDNIITTGQSDTFGGGAWSTRALTSRLVDTGDLCTTPAANAFTLDKGWYKVSARIPFANVTIPSVVQAVSRLYNITDAAAVCVSTVNSVSNIDNAAHAIPNTGVNHIVDTFYTDGTKSYRIDTWASGGSGNYSGGVGFFTAGTPTPNRFTVVELQKIG